MNADNQAREIASELLRQRLKIVFAESCTCGWLAATLGTVPGISEVLCGSAVTYQNDTKSAWLGISAETLIDPGPVSEQVAREMVEGVLAMTPQADLAVSVTGHLGPTDDPLDGVVYMGLGLRDREEIDVSRLVLSAVKGNDLSPEQRRRKRLEEVIGLVLERLQRSLPS